MGDEMKYSEGQRNQIYEKYLRPLKLKISQILLYDTNAAADFLKKYSVHIDDQMYLLEAEDLKEEAKDDSNTICNVPRYLNVKIKEAGEEWIKVAYNGKEGYLKTTNITSEAVTPMIKEKNRIATLKNNLKKLKKNSL